MKQTGSRLNSESFRELSILTFAASEAPSYSPRHASGSEGTTARRDESVQRPTRLRLGERYSSERPIRPLSGSVNC